MWNVNKVTWGDLIAHIDVESLCDIMQACHLIQERMELNEIGDLNVNLFNSTLASRDPQLLM